MCDCTKVLAERILEKQKETYPKRDIIDAEDFWGSGFDNVAFTLGSQLGSKMYSSFVYGYTFTKANGEESKPKKETVRMFFSYCPFCGQKYEEA